MSQGQQDAAESVSESVSGLLRKLRDLKQIQKGLEEKHTPGQVEPADGDTSEEARRGALYTSLLVFEEQKLLVQQLCELTGVDNEIVRQRDTEHTAQGMSRASSTSIVTGADDTGSESVVDWIAKAFTQSQRLLRSESAKS